VVGFAARDRMPVPVAGHRHRVDRVDLAAGGAQARDQQPARCLDRHRDQAGGGVAVLGQQGQQPREPGRVVADAAAGQQPPVLVHQGDVMIIFGTVDSAVHVHTSSVLLDVVAVRTGLSRAGHARSLMEGLKGTAIRLAVRDPSCPQAPVLPRARRLRARVRGCSCGWLRPRPPIPARTALSADLGRRVAYLQAARRRRGPDLPAGVTPPGLLRGSPGTSRTGQIPPVCTQASRTSCRSDVDLAGRPRNLP
jgi:hypothetical protein